MIPTASLPVIFCPKCSGLILAQPKCPHCGWLRPSETAPIGKLAWNQPADLSARLGGPSAQPAAVPALADEVVCFGTENGGLVGLIASTGEEKWRRPLEPGLVAHHVLAHERQLLAVVMDARPVEQAAGGRVQCWSPAGELRWEHSLSSFRPSDLAVAGPLAYFTTADRRLHCLNLTHGEAAWDPIGRVLPFSPVLGPALAGDRLFVAGSLLAGGQGVVACLSADTGQVLWQQPLAAATQFSLVQSAGCVLVGVSSRELACLDANTGRVRWQVTVAERGYAGPPTVAGDEIYIGGRAGTAQSPTYVLACLALENGVERWRAPVAKHIRVPPAVADGVVLCGTDAGQLQAFTPTGQPLWSYVVKPDTEHIRSHLLLAGPLVLFGTRNGSVHAIRWQAPVTLQPEAVEPEVLAEAGQIEAAAAAYALRGQLAEAAALYERAGPTCDLDRAQLLYQAAGRLSEAGRVLERLDRLDAALDLYKQVNDREGQVSVMLRQGDKLGAARLLEALGHAQADPDRLRHAAELFEAEGDRASALKLYRKLDDTEKVMALVSGRDRIMVLLDQQPPRLNEAVQEALRQNEYVLAADLLHRLGDEAGQLQVLLEHARANGEWQRLPLLAREQGRFELEAEALEHLGEQKAAAQAWHRAALQHAQRQPSDEAQVAERFGRARDLYRQVGLRELYLDCDQQYVRYARLPRLEIVGEAEDHFRLGEFKRLRLKLFNGGAGPARDIRVQLGGSFEPREQDRERKLEWPLLPGEHEVWLVFLRPMPGYAGEVWLYLEITYRDEVGRQYTPPTSEIRLYVAPDTNSTLPPTRVFNVNVTGGDVVLGEKKQVQGDFVAGDQPHVQGDVIGPGAQKGDRVVIERAGPAAPPAARVWSEPGQEAGRPREIEGPTVACPRCSLPARADQNFCEACRFPLNPEGGSQPA